MSEYKCWFCQEDLKNKTHLFSYEFDTPVCEECANKLKIDENFQNNIEGDIFRREFKEK